MTYRLLAPVGTFSIFLTTSIPSTTLPKTQCLPSRNSAGAHVMKNWVLVVPSGIAIAMREVGLRCDSDSNSDGGGRVALRVKGLVLLGECCKGIDGR